MLIELIILVQIIILLIFAMLSGMLVFFIAKRNAPQTDNKALSEQKEPIKILTKEEIKFWNDGWNQ